MLKVLFKKSVKSKLFMILFPIFTILSGAFISFPIIISALTSGSFSMGMTNNVMWAMTFCVFMMLLLIMLLVLKSVIFDNDLKFLIKVELQYRLKKTTIYFSRLFVLIIYAFSYITFILVCYFIYTSVFIQGHMKLSIFLASTIGYVAYLYLFALGTLAILFLTTFIKNNGFKFSIPFMLLFPFIGTIMYTQFSMVPDTNTYSYKQFISIEQELLNYQKFEDANFWEKYHQYFDNQELIKKIKTNIEAVFPKNQKINYDSYNMFLKHQTYYGMPPVINYNKNNRTITNIFTDLSVKGAAEYQSFYSFLAKMFSNFELNNMFNFYLVSFGENSSGFISQETFYKKAYDRTSKQYTISIDGFVAEHFIQLAKKYAMAIPEVTVNEFKTHYSAFKSEITTTGYFFFWKQTGYLLAGNTYNINDDFDRIESYMLSAPNQKIINFNFNKINGGYLILNAKIERTYSYEFLVIAYIIIIVFMNYLAFIIFSKKITP